MLNVVQRVVHEELQLRDDAQLMAHTVAEFQAHLLHIIVDIRNNFSTAL